MSMDYSTFDSFAPAMGRGFVEHSVQQPVQPRMHFLLASVPCGHVCAHRFGGFNRHARPRALHALTKFHLHAAAHDRLQCMPPTYCRAPREKDIDYIEDKKKSHESIVIAEKVIPPLFFLLRCRKTTPTLFRV